MSQLANQRANRLKQQAGLSGVPGISPEQAEQLANLDPQTLEGQFLRNLLVNQEELLLEMQFLN